MKRIQCTGCGQVFWTDLQLDETLVCSGEWIQKPCPKCGTNWAVVEPGAGALKGRRRNGRPGRKPRVGAKGVVRGRREKTPGKPEEGVPEFSASGIRKLRKKLGISQKKLASLVGVSAATVVAWEGGKYKPRDGKAGELSNLAKVDKAEVRNLLVNKESKPAEEKSAEGSPVEKTQIKGMRRARRKAGQKASEEK
jgi:DNA-binding transcriptional regulator YiaG